MSNGNDALYLGNGKRVTGIYTPPDRSRIPLSTEHVFTANNGDRVSADDPETLSKKMEAALQEKEEERRKRKREAARKAPSA